VIFREWPESKGHFLFPYEMAVRLSSAVKGSHQRAAGKQAIQKPLMLGERSQGGWAAASNEAGDWPS
jgi:hypothetical protein